MSLPAISYYCTKCDFRGGDLGTWGLKEYVLPNGVRVGVHWRLGWCEDCVGLAAVENLDSDERLKDLAEAKAELGALPPHPMRHWWQLHGFMFNHAWQKQLEAWERERFHLQCKLDDAQDALEHLKGRKQPPRCLACGSDRVHSPLITNPEPWNDPSQPHHTGFVHPGCGGELWRREEDMRFALKPTVRRYSPEGDFLEKEFVEGYTVPDGEYFENLESSNAKARGRSIPLSTG
ncbi:hypothetical protein F8A87_09810 [Betaproteobacteria bacterium SCN2]|jgi:hypothetical protein|nr:hypothetical protein F8A87_09810 [Betaproteobacteria bacterium SCN2]